MNVKRTWVVIIVLVIILGAWWIYQSTNMNTGNQTANTTPPGTPTSTTPVFDQSISDKTITIRYPSADFALATTPAQVLAKAYIPPCSEGFEYCFYYKGDAFAGTNFESAGIRIQKRAALTTRTKCLNTEPDGFTNQIPKIASSTDYATSAFGPLGDAAAGHLASGMLYRLFYKSQCYEIETRIGQTQFANYPPGTIKQFTQDNEASLRDELQSVLIKMTLPSGESISFPQV